MDIQRAIEIIKRKSSIPNDGESFDEIEKAYDMAIEALEKQISISREIRHGDYFCPKCGSNVEYQGYCHACGQRVY